METCRPILKTLSYKTTYIMDGLRRALLGVPRQVDPRSGSPRFGGLGDWGIGGEGALEMSGCFSMISMVVLLELFGQSCRLPI